MNELNDKRAYRQIQRSKLNDAVADISRQAQQAADQCPHCGADLSRGMHRGGCPVG
jgi:hypothetical protein